jgi:hypothetical protein
MNAVVGQSGCTPLIMVAQAGWPSFSWLVEAEPHWYSSRRSLRSWLAGLPLVVAGLGAVLVAPPPGGPVQRVPEVAQWRENQGGE